MRRIAVIAALPALAAPVAAEAATYSVAPGQGGTCGGPDLQCGSLADAAAAVASGDVVEVAPGEYASATFDVGGVTVKGTAAGVIVNGSLAFTGAAGGVAKLQRVVIRRTSGAGPALEVSGAAGLELSDALVVSVAGHGALFSGGAANKVERSTLDSSQARRLVDPGVGNIAASVTDSIVLNGSVTASFDGLLSGDNAATLNFTRTRRDGDPSALFVSPARFNFHLRAGSPAIDQGGITAGESTTDVDGHARPCPVTDQGADEFVNRPPVAKVSASPARARQRQPVVFSGAGSADPDGPLKEYRWTFSDGSSQTTSGAQVSKDLRGRRPRGRAPAGRGPVGRDQPTCTRRGHDHRQRGAVRLDCHAQEGQYAAPEAQGLARGP